MSLGNLASGQHNLPKSISYKQTMNSRRSLFLFGSTSQYHSYFYSEKNKIVMYKTNDTGVPLFCLSAEPVN